MSSKIDFPANITPVHFIKLRLYDERGKEVSDNFYWRSTNRYEGPETLTGPTTAGFEAISDLKPAKVSARYAQRTDEQGHRYIDVTLRNGGQALAFFTQLQLLDAGGKPVRPSFYTDNFFRCCRAKAKR